MQILHFNTQTQSLCLRGYGVRGNMSALPQINMPAPVGMICVGLFLRNAAGAVLITGLKPSWSKEIRAAALAMIFLRSGLELNLSVQPLISIVVQINRIISYMIYGAEGSPRYAESARHGILKPLVGLQVFKTIGVPAVKLLLIPGLVEAFFNGGLAVALFGMTPLFGFALGFILKAIGPALVIQLMFELQQKRLGLTRSECRSYAAGLVRLQYT